MRVKHKWTRVIAAKPSNSIFFEADGRNRTKLFALLNLIQPHPSAILEWRSKNRTISQRAWSDFVFSIYPSDDQVAIQHIGNHCVVRFVLIKKRCVECVIGYKLKPRVD